MKRFRSITIAVIGLLVLVSYAAPTGAKAHAGSPTPPSGARAAFLGYHDPLCQSAVSLCADVYDDPGGEYVGHDEPSLEFKSGAPGSGNDMTYTVTMPKDPSTLPTASGAGATWNFQLRPTF